MAPSSFLPSKLFLSPIPSYLPLHNPQGPISPSFLKPFPPIDHPHHQHQSARTPRVHHPLSSPLSSTFPSSTDSDDSLSTSPPKSSSSSWLPTRRELLLLFLTLSSLALFFGFGHMDIDYTDANGLAKSVTVGLGGQHHRWSEGGNGVGMWDEEEGKEVRGADGRVDYLETSLVQHAPGWTIFSNLYQLGSTFIIVTSNPAAFPEIRMMTSTSAEVFNGAEAVQAREPTEKNMRVISPEEAHVLFRSDDSLHHFGLSPIRQSGPTWLVNDPPQFLTHYYHFGAELIFGLWRTFSSMDRGINAYGETTHLGMPRRMIFTATGYEHWRDYSGMNGLIMKSVFPRTKLEFSQDFQLDRVASARPFVYDQLVFADRAASMRGSVFARTGRTASEAFLLPGSPYWFAPIRRKLLQYVGVPENDLAPGHRHTDVVTYVSRQSWGRRMLKEEDHEELVRVMTQAAMEDGFEFNVVEMDKLDNQQQIRLAARTTILMGVHGNGLTHLLFMKPTTRSTVMEFFYPGGFAYDYEFTTRGLGMAHYGFHGAQRFTSPDTPPVAYPEGFQGNDIPIDAQAVLEVVRMRLSGAEEADDG